MRGGVGDGEGTCMTACEGPYESGGKCHSVPPLVSAPPTETLRSATAPLLRHRLTPMPQPKRGDARVAWKFRWPPGGSFCKGSLALNHENWKLQQEEK